MQFSYANASLYSYIFPFKILGMDIVLVWIIEQKNYFVFIVLEYFNSWLINLGAWYYFCRQIFENGFIITTKSQISIVKEILIILNKGRLVAITNCMMHFPKLPNRSLFIDISRGGGCFMCVCALVIKSARQNLFLPKWECDWEADLKDDSRTALHSCSQSHSYNENVLILVRCVKAPEAIFFIRKRSMTSKTRVYAKWKLICKYDADSPLNHITRRTFNFRDLYLVSYLFLVCLFRECMSS